MKDCLFPYFCEQCGMEGEWWCKDCRGPVSAFSFSANTTGQTDLAVELRQVTAFFHYNDAGPLTKLIKDFKYQFVTDLEELWREVIGETSISIEKDFVVVPVPLFKKRWRERGFNQAEILGKIFAEKFKLSYDQSGLLRIKSTGHQARLSKEERIKNMSEAFAWQSSDPAPRKVLLVDDVYTTGATMQECARVLKKNGTKVVEGLVLAHG